jgi:hypothetical protein
MSSVDRATGAPGAPRIHTKRQKADTANRLVQLLRRAYVREFASRKPDETEAERLNTPHVAVPPSRKPAAKDRRCFINAMLTWPAVNFFGLSGCFAFIALSSCQ